MNPKLVGPPRNRHERRRVAAEGRKAARALAKGQAQRTKKRWSKASWTITTNGTGFAVLGDGSFWATPLPAIVTTSMPCTHFSGSFSIASVVKAEHDEPAPPSVPSE